MKRIFGVLVVAFVATMLVGCSDNTGNGDLTTDASESGTIVVKAALVDALWEDVLAQLGETFDEGEGPDATARCVAESSFEIADGGFMIAANPDEEPTDYNSTPAFIVTSLNLTLPEADADGRGASCGDGPLYFIVGASEESPIDIVVGEGAASDVHLDHLVASGATSFPGECRAVIHFERHGGADLKCGPMIPIEEPEVTEEPDEEAIAVTRFERPIMQPTQLIVADESADGADADDEAAEAEEPTDEAPAETGDILDDISCENDPKLMTLKVVIDDYSCGLVVE